LLSSLQADLRRNEKSAPYDRLKFGQQTNIPALWTIVIGHSAQSAVIPQLSYIPLDFPSRIVGTLSASTFSTGKSVDMLAHSGAKPVEARIAAIAAEPVK